MERTNVESLTPSRGVVRHAKLAVASGADRPARHSHTRAVCHLRGSGAVSGLRIKFA
jgi:hypothetical protein